MLRVTAWVKRFIVNLKRKKSGSQLLGALEVGELRQAELEWIRVAQQALKDEREYKQLERQYGLIEKGKVLYCTGRLGDSELDSEAREPLVLPRKHTFSESVITVSQFSYACWSYRSTLAQLRTKYWLH